MGIGRWLWRRTGIGETIDTVCNIVDEKSFTKGIKRTFKEEVFEDNPIMSIIYRTGRSDGKADGYVEASEVYEEKLLKQAQVFFEEKEKVAKMREEYEALLDEFEKEIERLSSIEERTEEENRVMDELICVGQGLFDLANEEEDLGHEEEM